MFLGISTITCYLIDPNEAKRFAEDNERIYIQTSAKTGKNVEEAFIELTKGMISKVNF